MNSFAKTFLRWIERVFGHVGLSSVKNVFTFFELDIQNTDANDHEVNEDIEFLTVEKAALEKTDKYYDGWFDKARALQRLEKGRLLFAVRCGGKLAYIEWLEFDEVQIPKLDLSFRIPDTMAYTAWMFTAPEFRGKGLASEAKPYILRYLRDLGCRHHILVIKPGNVPSYRVNKRAGFNEYQTVAYRKFLIGESVVFKYYVVSDINSNRKKVLFRIGEPEQQALWEMFRKQPDLGWKHSPSSTS